MSVGMQVRSSDTPHKAGGLGHFKTGATALVVNELLELQRRYAEFQREFAESTAKQIDMETDMAIQVGKNIVESARAEASRIRCDAVGSAISSAAQFAAAGVSTRGMKTDSMRLQTAETNVQKARLLETKCNERLATGRDINVERTDPTMEGQPRAILEDVTTREGAFTTENGELRLSDAEIARINTTPKTQLELEVRHWQNMREVHQQEVVGVQSSRNAATTRAQMWGGFASEGGKSMCTGFGSMYANERGEKDRDRTLAETAKQLADGGVQATRQKITESERQALDLSDVLKRMNQENTFRG